ncbi:DUF4166 domain-containing protein [Pelagibius sp.]|uniref:DUF4166 domain-containing protein n=1 Tax=Pelagibius sp. TaxID=1931238 RepID=UPI002619DAD3|nr:DUF4166 domain-containing protein [Pelagibius sp.]
MSVAGTGSGAFVPLYRRVLGGALDRLPGPLRRLHDHDGASSAAGRCDVERGDGLAARLVAACFGMPPAGRDLPVRVRFSTRDGVETWERDFAGHRLSSRQGAEPARPGHLYERFGIGHFILRPEVSAAGLDLRLVGVRLLRLPLPRRLWPRIVGRERVDGAGRFTFEVSIVLPLAGLLIAYRGYLVPEGEGVA